MPKTVKVNMKVKFSIIGKVLMWALSKMKHVVVAKYISDGKVIGKCKLYDLLANGSGFATENDICDANIEAIDILFGIDREDDEDKYGPEGKLYDVWY